MLHAHTQGLFSPQSGYHTLAPRDGPQDDAHTHGHLVASKGSMAMAVAAVGVLLLAGTIALASSSQTHASMLVSTLRPMATGSGVTSERHSVRPSTSMQAASRVSSTQLADNRQSHQILEPISRPRPPVATSQAEQSEIVRHTIHDNLLSTTRDPVDTTTHGKRSYPVWMALAGLPVALIWGFFANRRHKSPPAKVAMAAMLQAGIVGLPNVGKSTLFNALMSKSQAEAANFPFCTIEPNIGIVSVPDPRLDELSTLSNSKSVVPTRVEFCDIAGLVAGASQGEGLGNKFLANIREVDAILHVVRCFEDDDIIHVSGSVGPVRDADIINLELLLADSAQIEKRRTRLQKQMKTDKEAVIEDAALIRIEEALNAGNPARSVELNEDEERLIKNLGLLTRKPIIYAANVSEDDLAEGNAMSKEVAEMAAKESARCVRVSAQVEAELADLAEDEGVEFLAALGVDEGGLQSLIRETYTLLGLRTYFTTGEKETRAWTIKAGYTAPQAAGVIHTDFEKGFIRAQTVAYDKLVEAGSIKDAKEKGWVRSEGKEYVVDEGDVMEFLFNV